MTEPTFTREQLELFRIAGERILRDAKAGRKFAPDVLADARRWASIPPLPHPLSSGEPVPDEHLPAPLRGGALEVF